MRHTLMLNLDERHARLLEELRKHFKLSADDTVRFAICWAHAQCMKKPGALVPEFKPCAKKDKQDFHDPSPLLRMERRYE